jgi:hypothetical protein
MKKTALCSIIIMTFTLSLKAQIYTPTGIIQGTSGNNNVGIGTTNPSEKLSVLGGISRLTLTGVDGTFDNLIKYGHKSDLESGTSYANRWHGIDATITAGTPDNNKLKFRLYAGGAGNAEPIDVMTLLGNGKVGIGTTTPNQKLDVNGNINMAGVAGRRLFMGGAGGSTFGIAYDSNYPNYGIFYTEAEPDYVSISPNGNATAGVMNILGNGNVGIGEPNPYSKLAIKDGNQILNFLTNQKLVGTWPPTSEGTTMTIQSSGTSSGNLAFATGNTENMRIIPNGNVGIGTPIPDSKLTVNGKIHAQEVKIDLLSPMTVPDYVFASDYKLKTLQEVEEYIKQNNHLPEIPSAKEIEKNGLMLAEMNLILLKKMEEMTLYMIDFKKEMDVLKEENKIQKEEIKMLKKIKKL